MQFNKVVLNLMPALLFATSQAEAGNIGASLQNAFGRLSPVVATLSVGPAWDSAGANQTFFVAPGIQKTYAANNNAAAFGDAELFLGFDRILNDITEGQFGLAVAVTSKTKLSGAIWDDANSTFDGLNYTYTVQHSHIAAKGKFLIDMNCSTKPYVSGSIGVGYNQSRDFDNVPVIFAAIPTPNFAPKSTTSLTYTLGVGLQGPFSKHWQLGVGYEFADWGKSLLNPASQQTLGDGLSLSHLYTNGLVVSLSFIA